MDALVGRVRLLWADLAGGDGGFPAAGEVRVVVSPACRLCPPGWVGTVTIGGGVLVTVPVPGLVAPVEAAVAAGGVQALRAALAADDELGPAELAYADEVIERPGPIERVAADSRALRRLLESADPAEVDESGLDGIGSAVAVIRAGGRVVAAAGYHLWPARTAHLGILTAPEARGRGLATRVAAAATADALAAGLLPQWRARVPASQRVAAKLGYRILGRQFSVHPSG